MALLPADPKLTSIEQVIAGLQIFTKYKGAMLDAQHDTIYAGCADDASISKEDQDRLKELDWFVSSEGWQKFT
jgi:hypothetical protein